MYIAHANISFDRATGTPAWSLWTTEDAHRQGILSVNSVVPLRNLDLSGNDVDVVVGSALAAAALGSRLLRLGSTIGAQRPLFNMDMLERSE